MSNKKLILTCGVSGSGKSFHSQQFYHWCIDLNADLMRGVIGKDETDQEVNYPVFQTLERMAEYLMKQDRAIVISNTNYNKKNRKKWIELGKKYSYHIKAVVLKTPLDICFERNKKRSRVVPEDIIKKQFDNFEDPTKEEGFDEIQFIPV